MVNAQYSRQVASLETKEGCPIIPGSSFKKVFYLVPLASSNRDKHGIALDGYLKVQSRHCTSSYTFSTDPRYRREVFLKMYMYREIP
jgi:arrestin-2